MTGMINSATGDTPEVGVGLVQFISLKNRNIFNLVLNSTLIHYRIGINQRERIEIKLEIEIGAGVEVETGIRIDISIRNQDQGTIFILNSLLII